MAFCKMAWLLYYLGEVLEHFLGFSRVTYLFMPYWFGSRWPRQPNSCIRRNMQTRYHAYKNLGNFTLQNPFFTLIMYVLLIIGHKLANLLPNLI